MMVVQKSSCLWVWAGVEGAEPLRLPPGTVVDGKEDVSPEGQVGPVFAGSPVGPS